MFPSVILDSNMASNYQILQTFLPDNICQKFQLCLFASMWKRLLFSSLLIGSVFVFSTFFCTSTSSLLTQLFIFKFFCLWENCTVFSTIQEHAHYIEVQYNFIYFHQYLMLLLKISLVFLINRSLCQWVVIFPSSCVTYHRSLDVLF